MNLKKLPVFCVAFMLLTFQHLTWASPKIIDAYLLGMPDTATPDAKVFPQEKYTEQRQTIGINETLVVKIDGLKSMVSVPCDTPPCPLLSTEISLYINGKKIAERNIGEGPLGKEDDTVEFLLDYGANRPDKPELSDAIKKNWSSILGSPRIGPYFWRRPVEISVGVTGGDVIKYEKLIQLRRIDKGKFFIFIGIVIVFLLPFFFKRARKVIRDALSDAGNMPNTGEAKPWSLARCQMAFWFIISAISFLSIWLVTGALDTITGSVLALIGIGSGSALGSALIDASGDDQLKREKLEKRISELEGVTTNLKTQHDTVNAQITALPAGQVDKNLEANKSRLQARLKSVEALLIYVTNDINNQTNGFWNDLLNEGESAAFHRIQMFVWTLILGGIFVYSVWKGLSMPEFSETLLALQGISAGTYLGFKLPENKS
jgi:hypothetical protein